MTTYAVNKVCWMVEQSAEFREQLRSNPEAALAGFRLDEEERRALLAGDVVALFSRGAHPFLLQWLAHHRVLGLDRESYRQRITSLTQGG